jgi:hypothetical protein
MRSVTVRLMQILFITASAATGYSVWTSETALRTASDEARRFDDGAVAAARGPELRAAQHAYVTAGQGEQFWIAKAAAALTDLRRQSAPFECGAPPRAQTALDNALAVLHDFEQVDKRATDYARSGQRLIASDLIFSDGLEMTGTTLAALEEARGAARQDYEQSSSEIRQAELVALGSYAAFALLVVGLLVPVGKERTVQPQNAAISPAVFAASSRADDPLDRSSRTIGTPTNGQMTVARLRRSRPSTGHQPRLNRISAPTSRASPTPVAASILERTAAILNAAGIVLWIADPDGRG